MPPEVMAFGQIGPLSACTFTMTGNTFLGWATSAGGLVAYTDGESYTMGASSVTLYAVWAPNVSVTFDIEYQALAFSPSSVTLQIGTPLTAATSNATLLSGGTNWLWQLDGATISTQADLDYDTSGLTPGNHYLDVYVQYNGVLYSGNILVNTTY
jgi:plastocyanin